jgi:eukaryotic-like serine/threonine-protein kinase
VLPDAPPIPHSFEDDGRLPDRIGRYQILLELGSGGMASVYLARAVGIAGFERDVALKVVHPSLRDDNRSTRDLIQEAKVASRIRHTNVVPVLEIGEENRAVFVVMDYVDGDSLSQLVRAGEEAGELLPAPVAMRILCDALSGLHAAHEQRGEDGRLLGLVHRDFSPQNILLGRDGVARLADFGIAKVSSRPGKTQTGLIKGKLGYLSPEQARGLALDRRSDVWSAGVVAWELFAGGRMFGGTEAEALVAIVERPIPRLASARPDLPAALVAAIDGAVIRDVDRRYPTALDFRARLLASLPAADHGDVADYVSRVLAVRLAERQERAERVTRALLASGSTADPGGPTLSSATKPLGRTPSEPAARKSKARVLAASGTTVLVLLTALALVFGRKMIALEARFRTTPIETRAERGTLTGGADSARSASLEPPDSASFATASTPLTAKPPGRGPSPDMPTMSSRSRHNGNGPAPTTAAPIESSARGRQGLQPLSPAPSSAGGALAPLMPNPYGADQD